MSHQMNHPPVVELEKKAGCRYMLVTVVAKRARQILAADKNNPVKPVAQAVQELEDGDLRIDYPPEDFANSDK